MDEDLIENDDRMDITDENAMDDEEEAEDLSIKSNSSSAQDQVFVIYCFFSPSVSMDIRAGKFLGFFGKQIFITQVLIKVAKKKHVSEKLKKFWT